MATAIKVENLSKAYQLGSIGTGTLSRDLERWMARIRGKEDPFLTIGEANDRSVKGTNDIVLSLNNISFDIEQGDAVGIIGRNGAGKSTLLKLLSRVTSPTSGSIKVKGRIASLLEVGTGFHPELTGRENIFLNGAILGMRKKEIARKFDQIVDFAGVERYIDTPVKRYSSGMYVRLAFAVAAHLESEILIVDEVLAVGDAEFQKKCLGKMGDVSKGEGRTVLFVSHNMSSIKNLCNSGILLKNGELHTTGNIDKVLSAYKDLGAVNTSYYKQWDNIDEAPGNSIVKMLRVCAKNELGQMIEEIDVIESFYLEMDYEVLEEGHILWNSFNLFDDIGTNIFDTHSTTGEFYNTNHPKGKFKAKVQIPANFLNEGKLVIGCAIFNHTKKVVHILLHELINIQVIDHYDYSKLTARGQSIGQFSGVIRPMLQWQTEKVL